MRNKTIISAIGIMLGLTLLTGPALQASVWDKKTIISFPESMEIPGTVLPAGTYVVKRADGSLPNIMRFSNAEETEVYATVITVPTQRARPSDEVEIVLEERPTGSPEAIKKWFYPGELTGAEFVYPKSGNLLAAATPPVLFPSAQAAEPAEPAFTLPAEEPEEAYPSAAGLDEPAELEEPLEERQSEEPVEIAQAQPPASPGAPQAQPAPSRQVAPQDPAQEELPQTATSLTLASMLGGLAIFGGALLRRFSRRLS